MSRDGRIWLSHSGLGTLNRCPRCFWLQYKRKLRQPEGIVSRLANRFDKVMKSYFNVFRGTDKLPPIVEGQLSGKLQNPFQEKYFTVIDRNYGFMGFLDECLVLRGDKHAPVDFKTSSSDPRHREDILPAYYNQIDAYLFLLERNRKKIVDYGYLIFVYPEEGKTLHKGFPMYIEVKKVKGSSKKTLPRIKKAIKVLESDMPRPSLECPFCAWYDTVKEEIE